MSPELLAILRQIVGYAVSRPFEVRTVATLAGANATVVDELLDDAAKIAETISDDNEATSAILQKIMSRKQEILPPKKITNVSPTYYECPRCDHLFKG